MKGGASNVFKKNSGFVYDGVLPWLNSLCFCISLAYEYADNPLSRLTINGQTAYCVSQTDGDAVSITVTQTLEKYSGWFWIWNEVDGAKWSRTVNDNSIRLSNTKSGLDSGTYRLKSVFTLTNSSGKTETVTVYSEEEKVG